MIATVSSAARDYEETVNTLKYAIRAKAIKNSAVKNVSASAENNAIEMKEIIDSLKKENLVLQKQAEEASKAPPRTSKPLQNTESTGLLGELEARLRAYFKEEKSIRSERAKVEEEATALSEEMSQPHSNTDANIVKLSQLRIQKTKLSEDLSQKFRERSNLLEEINESGLTNLQLTYLTNIAVKEQIESELIDNTPVQFKSEQAVSVNDWNIQFLKKQVMMRDKVMNEQIDALEDNRLKPPVSFDGLRQIDNMPKDIRKSNEDLYLPPLFADKNRFNVQYAPQQNSVPIERVYSGDYQKKSKAIPKQSSGYLNAHSSRGTYQNPHKKPFTSSFQSPVQISKSKSLNKFRPYEAARNQYYKKAPDSKYSKDRQANNLPSLAVNTLKSQPYTPYRAGSSQNKPQKPRSAYKNPHFHRRHQFEYNNPAKSPYVQHFKENSWRDTNDPVDIKVETTNNANAYLKNAANLGPNSRPQDLKAGGSFEKSPPAGQPNYTKADYSRPESGLSSSGQAVYTKMTSEDFTLEALQRKKASLERLNQRLKYM